MRMPASLHLPRCPFAPRSATAPSIPFNARRSRVLRAYTFSLARSARLLLQSLCAPAACVPSLARIRVLRPYITPRAVPIHSPTTSAPLSYPQADTLLSCCSPASAGPESDRLLMCFSRVHPACASRGAGLSRCFLVNHLTRNHFNLDQKVSDGASHLAEQSGKSRGPPPSSRFPLELSTSDTLSPPLPPLPSSYFSARARSSTSSIWTSMLPRRSSTPRTTPPSTRACSPRPESSTRAG